MLKEDTGRSIQNKSGVKASEYREKYHEILLDIDYNSKTLDIGRSDNWGYENLFADYNCYELSEGKDFLNNDLGDGEYDVVMCNGVYEFIEDTNKMISEVYRILKSGGTAVFGFAGDNCKTTVRPKRLHNEKQGIELLKGFDFIKSSCFPEEYYYFIAKKS